MSFNKITFFGLVIGAIYALFIFEQELTPEEIEFYQSELGGGCQNYANITGKYETATCGCRVNLVLSNFNRDEIDGILKFYNFMDVNISAVKQMSAEERMNIMPAQNKQSALMGLLSESLDDGYYATLAGVKTLKELSYSERNTVLRSVLSNNVERVCDGKIMPPTFSETREELAGKI